MLLFLVACEDVVQIDVPETDPRLVIEGWVYDNQDTQTIVLRNSIAYFTAGTLPPETEAQVMVTTASGERFTFVERKAGVYQASFRGSVGESYTLNIETLAGQQYVSAPQEMLPVPPLDSVYAIRGDSTEEGADYHPAWDYTDPAGVENYYRWRFYINDSLQNKIEESLVVSDEFIDGKTIIGAEFLNPLSLSTGDTLTIEQLSLTREAYNFLIQVEQLAGNTGGLFDTQPDPVRANVTNVNQAQDYVLGYFGVSSAVRATTTVVNDE